MQDTFFRAASDVVGARVASITLAAQQPPVADQRMKCYIFDPSRAARDFANTGIMKFVKLDGVRIPYTHTNYTGLRRDSTCSIAWCGIGQNPVEEQLSLNTDATRAYNQRIGRQVKRLLADVQRPEMRTAEFDPRKNLG